MRNIAAFLCFIFVLSVATNAQSIPNKMSYQGILKEAGVPVDGTRTITFSIADWSESQELAVTDGHYSAVLGAVNPIPSSVFEQAGSQSLEITIDGETFTPSMELLSVPYAFFAERADYSTPDGPAGGALIGNYPNPSIRANVINGTHIQDRSITAADLNFSPLTNPYFGNFQANTLKTGNPSSSFQTGDIVSDNNVIADGNVVAAGKMMANEMEITNDLTVNDDVSITDNLEVDGEIEVRQDVNVGKDVNVDDDIKVKDDVDVGGDLDVDGRLTKGSGSFKIDHPVHPESMFLSHSFVESPDMMNVYNGNVELDADGKATVELENWFESLNKDFRYQLTCIGGFAPVYIAKEIEGNQFQIAGGTPGMKVSWQVTGIRKDAYAEKNRIEVESHKSPNEVGKYLHPEAFNQPPSKKIEKSLDQEDDLDDQDPNQR